MDDLKGKRALVFGLGLLGGGVATTNWLLKHGAVVTVTDLKTKKQLAPSLKKIRGKVKLALGGHSEELIRGSDIVVANPDVPADNRYVRLALRLGTTVTNETMLFYDRWPKPLVGVTGTRGKTTTTHWISHFLSADMRSTPVGNSADHPFLKMLDRAGRFDIAVAETPSFQLGLFTKDTRTPDIAVITNLYADHLNWHGTLQKYASAKANIFRHQSTEQCVILNADSPWTKYFLNPPAGGKPRSYVWLFSKKPRLPKRASGVFFKDNAIWYQFGGHAKRVLDVGDFVARRGEHNLENLLAAALAAYLAGCSGEQIRRRLATLPEIPFRQEVVFKSKRLTIVNDTTATSPEGCIAAVKRFAVPIRSRKAKEGRAEVVLIAGGTDRQLDFRQWGKIIPRFIKPGNLVLLEGSATAKMQASLKRGSFGKGKVAPPRQTLAECLAAALAQAQEHGHWVVLFSPGAKSFEKFKNEYDRGRRFNALVKKEIER